MRYRIALCWLITGFLVLALSDMTISTPMRSILAQGATEQAASTPTPSPRGIHLANLQTIMGSNSGRIIPLTRLGRGRLNSLVWSRDGKTLAVASSVGVWLYASDHWDDEPAFLEGLDSDVSSIAFSPDGKLLVSGSNDRSVQLWDLQTGRNVAILQHHSVSQISSTEVTFSPDGRLVAFDSGEDGDTSVQLWNVQTQQTVGNLRGHIGEVNSLAFSPDGKWLVSGGGDYDKTVRVWDVNTEKTVFVVSNYPGSVLSVAFSPDGKRLASGSWNGLIRLTDVRKRANVANLKTSNDDTDTVTSLAFSPDGKLLASGTRESGVRLWDAKTHQTITTLTAQPDEGNKVAFSPDGKLLAFGSGTNGDTSVQLWNVQTQQTVASLPGYSKLLTSMALSPDGQVLASGGLNKTVRLWDVQSGQITAVWQADLVPKKGLSLPITDVNSLAFSPDGKLLASGNEDNSVLLWDMQADKTAVILEGVTGPVESVAFSPDGKLLASGDFGGELRLWDVQTGHNIAGWQEGTDILGAYLHHIAFSPDSKLLASANGEESLSPRPEFRANDKVWLWDAQTGHSISVLQGHSQAVYGVAFSPDGKMLASGSWDGTVRLWDVQSGQTLSVLKENSRISIYSIAFSPDGKLLAAGNNDHWVRLWDVQSGQTVAVLRGHTGIINSIAFSADGKLLATASFDGSVVLWGVPTQ